MTHHFPVHRAHEGIWEGEYRHVDNTGKLLEAFRSRVICEFPDNPVEDGQIFYRQTTHLTDENGNSTKAVFEGIHRGDHLWYDAPTFAGKSWETQSNVILLDLKRKDEPGANFVEAIIMGEGGKHRARTWHWFKEGRLYKRTLCEESRV